MSQHADASSSMPAHHFQPPSHPHPATQPARPLVNAARLTSHPSVSQRLAVGSSEFFSNTRPFLIPKSTSYAAAESTALAGSTLRANWLRSAHRAGIFVLIVGIPTLHKKLRRKARRVRPGCPQSACAHPPTYTARVPPLLMIWCL